MNISSENHALETVRAWMQEDRAFIKDLLDTRNMFDSMLIKYAHNPNIRVKVQEAFDNTNKMIEQEKADYRKNYGETYKLLSK